MVLNMFRNFMNLIGEQVADVEGRIQRIDTMNAIDKMMNHWKRKFTANDFADNPNCCV